MGIIFFKIYRDLQSRASYQFVCLKANRSTVKL
jgi:hypothetical protein